MSSQKVYESQKKLSATEILLLNDLRISTRDVTLECNEEIERCKDPKTKALLEKKYDHLFEAHALLIKLLVIHRNDAKVSE